MQMPGQCVFLTVMLSLSLFVLPCSAQHTGSETQVQAKRIEIPRYLPLARQAHISGEVTLHMVVNKASKVVSVDVVKAQPDGWGKGFAEMAIDAAKKSEFMCTSCSGDTFEHTLTYQFEFPPIPKDACTLQPPLPPSTVDSVSHVTIRPGAWPCVVP